MDDDRLADVIQELSEDDQKELLAHLDEARAADILEAMDPDDAADLLAELPEGIQERLLGLMEPEESAPVRRLLQYSSDIRGRPDDARSRWCSPRTRPSPRRWPGSARPT